MPKALKVLVTGGAGFIGSQVVDALLEAGHQVVVLERSERVGGAAVTEELTPGFHFSTCADGSGHLAAEVVRDLKLESRIEILSADPVAVTPQPDGSHLAIWRDTQRTAREIEHFSKTDAARYPAFVELMRKLAGVVGGLMRVVPPDLPEIGLGDLRGMLPLLGPVRRLGRGHLNDLLRILPMPAADLLDEWFESDVLKGVIAANGVRDITWGPKEAGTAYTLLYQWALADTGLFRSSGVVRGGIGKLTEALAAAAGSSGAEIRTSAPVEEILVQDGRVRGVALAGGERIEAPLVASSADLRTTFLELLDPTVTSANVVRHVRNIKYRGSAARIHLALRELPEFSALGEDAPTLLRGPIQIAPTLSYIQRAYDCVKYGEYSPRPYLDVTIPTLLDPSLAPDGQHVLSITAKYAPYALRDADWKDKSEPFSEAVLDTLAEYAPKIRDLVVERHTLVPPDLEARFGLPEGNPHHGEMTLDQFFHMRPIPGYARYRAPVSGLYLCGAGAHPGGGVTGIPGRNAALAMLKDRA